MPIDDDLKSEILSSISLEGASAEENKEINVVLGSRNNLSHIVDFASGLPRIRTSVINRFALILSQPVSLKTLNPLLIRCCLCGRIISYPAWHYYVKFAVNHFHYFVCFNSESSAKPTAKCYRRMM